MRSEKSSPPHLIKQGLSYVIATNPTQMLKGAGAGNAEIYTTSFPMFSLGAFIANGASIHLESITGNTSLYDVSFFVQKTYAAR